MFDSDNAVVIYSPPKQKGRHQSESKYDLVCPKVHTPSMRKFKCAAEREAILCRVELCGRDKYDMIWSVSVHKNTSKRQMRRLGRVLMGKAHHPSYRKHLDEVDLRHMSNLAASAGIPHRAFSHKSNKQENPGVGRGILYLDNPRLDEERLKGLWLTRSGPSGINHPLRE